VQFTLASTVYFTFSKLFPAHETMLDHVILEEETPQEDASSGGDDDDDKKDRDLVDVVKVA